jgi:hypothetical protein
MPFPPWSAAARRRFSACHNLSAVGDRALFPKKALGCRIAAVFRVQSLTFGNQRMRSFALLDIHEKSDNLIIRL